MYFYHLLAFLLKIPSLSNKVLPASVYYFSQLQAPAIQISPSSLKNKQTTT